MELKRKETIHQLTQAQKDLVRGLKLFGCSWIQTLTMLAMLWHRDDLVEMLRYMVDNLDSTPAQLYEMCSRISSRRPGPESLEM